MDILGGCRVFLGFECEYPNGWVDFSFHLLRARAPENFATSGNPGDITEGITMGITMEGRITSHIVDPVTTGLLNNRRTLQPIGLERRGARSPPIPEIYRTMGGHGCSFITPPKVVLYISEFGGSQAARGFSKEVDWFPTNMFVELDVLDGGESSSLVTTSRGALWLTISPLL